MAVAALGFLMALATPSHAAGLIAARQRVPSPIDITCAFVDAPGSICGQRGTVTYWYSGSLAGESIVRDLITCRQLCGNRLGAAEFACDSFSFDEATGLCQLYHRPVADQEFRANETSSTIAYDVDCISCSTACPATSTSNQMENGGFDFSPEYFGPWDKLRYAGSLAARGFQSNTSFFCPADDYLNCQLAQYRSLCPGQLYRLTARVLYRPGRRGTNHPSIQLLTEELIHGFSYQDTDPRNTWRQFEATFVARQSGQALPILEISTFPTSNQIGSGAGAGAAAGIYFDDIVVVPASYDTPTQAGNLIPNGGFDNGLTGWSTRYRPPCSEVCDPAARQGRFEVVDGGLGTPTAFRYTQGYLGTATLESSPFTLVIGTRYVLSFDYRIDLYSTFVVVDSADWRVTFRLPITAGRTERFERVFTAGSTSVNLYYTFRAIPQSGDVVVDSIRLARVA